MHGQYIFVRLEGRFELDDLILGKADLGQGRAESRYATHNDRPFKRARQRGHDRPCHCHQTHTRQHEHRRREQETPDGPPEGPKTAPRLDPVTCRVEAHWMLLTVIALADQRELLDVEACAIERLDGVFGFNMRIEDIKGNVFLVHDFPWSDVQRAAGLADEHGECNSQ
jgi:hypothetical protein